jgi:hypothetical protein
VYQLFDHDASGLFQLVASAERGLFVSRGVAAAHVVGVVGGSLQESV